MICHVFLNVHFQIETLQILTIVVTEIIAILSRTRYTKKEKYIGFFGKGQYMCKKKEAESTLDSLVFMNTPITSADEDVIGFSTYVEKLDAAITAGGQMIALTSPFGAGKTSIVELLQEKYRENQHKRVIKISMWSNLFPTGGNGKADREEGQKTHIHSGDTTELHKGLVYQLISQISWRKGNYVSRRLSQNFGLLKVQTDKLPYWISILVALVLFSLGYIFPKKLAVSIPFFGEAAAIIEWCMLLIAAILVAIVITRAEIVFSSNKSEGDRKIDANEIMQFYRSDVLRYKSGKAVLQKVPILKRRSRHYIVVIEDLDRTDDNDAVVNFLKELRKYYVPDSVAGQQCRYRNKVTFLINVKPETLLCSRENAGEEYGHLYEKLFDYVLNLQTINIDDYKTILNELLKQKETDIKKIGIEWEGEVLNIPGIQWIIRGTRLGLREIKDRLNIAFSLFESLHERFSGNAGGDIEFEKCAISCCHTIYHYDKDGTATRETNPWYGQPIPAYRRGYTLFANSHLPEKITVFGVGQRTQDIYNADILRDILAKTVITRTFEEVTGKDIKRIHQEPIPFSAEEKAVWVQAVKEFHTMRQKYFTSTNNARKDAMLRIIQQITLLLRISAAPNTVSEYSGELPGKLQKAIQLTGSWAEEIVAIGVRHTVVLDAYAAALREAFPNRPLFIVTGATTTFAKRRALRQTLRESGNGILLCTQQSLPSSVNFEFVNKVIIPELHYNNSRMSQFYMRFIRFNSVDWKDIYFLTYAQSIESNLMQMILAKEKLNLFMKGDEADMDDIYERFGVDYDLTSLLLYRDIDEDGRFSIRWGEQEIA